MNQPPHTDSRITSQEQSHGHAHWRANRHLMMLLLSIWFTVSYLLGIVFVEPLNQFHLGGFPLGFWFAQQGSLYVFIILIFLYAHLMDRVDQRYGIVSKSSPDRSHPTSESSE